MDMAKKSNSLIDINLDGYRPINVQDCKPGDKVIISLKTYTVDDVQNEAVQLHESDSLVPVPFEYIGACYTKRRDLPKVPGLYISNANELLYLSASSEWYEITANGGNAEIFKVLDNLLYKYSSLTFIDLPE